MSKTWEEWLVLINTKGKNSMKYDVKTTIKTPASIFKPEMLVQHTDGSIGIITLITKKYIHVLWLINTDPDDATNLDRQGNHHFVGMHTRGELKPCVEGTTVTLTQITKA